MYDIFKSIIDTDRAPVVICNVEHTIIYMNKVAAEHYRKYGGNSLLGKSLLACHNEKSCELINKVVAWFKESKNNNMIYTSRNNKENKDVYMVALRDEEGNLIAYYEKHEYRNKEERELYDFSDSLV